MELTKETMDKETKELLKRTLAMTDDKLLLKFAKSYAAKDQAFAEAIIEKFLPIENNVDYKKMVTDCFLHRKKGGARRYGSSLDWTAIRKDIKRVLKQLDYLRQQQDGVTAAEGALLMLEKLADEFNNDCVYQDYNYENSNFGNEQALAIVNDVLLNDKYVARDHKMGIIRRLQRLAKSDVYSTYLPCDIDEVIDNANRSLLSPEDLLKEIDKNIQTAKYSSDKAYYVKWKIDLLRELGHNDEAENTLSQYLDLEVISALKYDQMVADSRYDEAKAFCKERIGKSSGGWHDAQPWHQRLVELGQRTNDKDIIRTSAQWLFAKGNIRQEEKKDYYHICKATFGKDDWPAHRDIMLQKGEDGNVGTDMLFELYQEEKLFDKMYAYLQKLPDHMGYYSYAPYQNSGGKRLAFFSRYANLLTDKQCAEMVDALFKSIQLDSRRAKTRDDYARVASGLHLLGLSCEKGKQQACRLAAQILRDNPKKPAFREEIGKYEY